MQHTWRAVGGIVVLFGMIALLLAPGCVRRSTAAVAPTVAFNTERAWADMQQQLDFGYRVPGTAAHQATQAWLVEQLAATTDAVTLQPFTHQLAGKTVTMWNIIAVIPGTGVTPRERVLLAAHWDTRPTSEHDADPTKHHLPVPGANDGASGVAVLLEIARQLRDAPLERDVMIVLFDGEDYGPELDTMLLGSRYFAKHLPDPRPDWGILLDMVGKTNVAISREPLSERAAKAVNDRVFRAARRLGYLKARNVPGFVDAIGPVEITDDHVPLNAAGIPTVVLIDFDYPQWHTTHDTIEYCSPESLNVVGRTVLSALQAP